MNDHPEGSAADLLAFVERLNWTRHLHTTRIEAAAIDRYLKLRERERQGERNGFGVEDARGE